LIDIELQLMLRPLLSVLTLSSCRAWAFSHFRFRFSCPSTLNP
jgi:hypothetical protein